MHRKLIPSLIIALILVNLFAPFSVGLKNNTPIVQNNIAEAGESSINFKWTSTENSITIVFTVVRVTTYNHALLWVAADNNKTITGFNSQDVTYPGNGYDNSNLGPENVFTFVPSTNILSGKIDVSNNITPGSTVTKFSCKDPANSGETCIEKTITTTVPGLIKNKKYYFSYWGYNGNQPAGILSDLNHEVYTTNGGMAEGSFSSQNLQAATADAKAKADQACKNAEASPNDQDLKQKCLDALKVADTASQAERTANGTNKNFLPACWLGITSGFSIPGCFAQLLYYALFAPTSYVFGLTGKFFDAAFGYSVTDTSYRSQFVVQGWGLVRDFVNIFFIFVLLYIAFATVLQVHGFKTKEMIINVVIIGLLMNFSLFAAQVIIDSSNILARVFYNSNAIKITDKNNTNTVTADTTGNLKLSEAIVSKVNPQKLIAAGNKVDVSDPGNPNGSPTTSGGIGAGTFIVITLLATAVNIVGMIVFLSVGLIFVSRVIGLWLYMIFAPFAFFSYTVPAMQGFEMVGWKKWWPELLSMSFLAPIFIFFMYLIIKFLDTGLGLVGTYATKTGLDFVIGIIIPFAFIMILLMKAKSIAKKMSGSLGQSITGAISQVGGFALGAATGGTAMLGRATIGRAGSAIANSTWAKRAESKGVFGARALRSLGSAAGKGSMDIRGAKVAGKGLSDAGIKGLGKPKEGGFEKIRADKVVARQKRANELKVGEDEKLKQNLNAVETDLQGLLRANSHELEQLDKQITTARQNAADTASASKLDPRNAAKKADAVNAAAKLSDLKGQKSARKNATSFTASTGIVYDFTANVSTNSRSINQLEDHDIPDAHHHVEEENKNRNWNYAKVVSSDWNKFKNFVSSGGQHSSAGADEAAHKIRMEMKLDSGDKAH